MRISDWSSDVCSSDLAGAREGCARAFLPLHRPAYRRLIGWCNGTVRIAGPSLFLFVRGKVVRTQGPLAGPVARPMRWRCHRPPRSEEHTSELQSLMRISYAVFCLKKKNNHNKRLL